MFVSNSKKKKLQLLPPPLPLSSVLLLQLSRIGDMLNNSNRMRLHVFANDAIGQILLMAIYDNLGKGASGAAVQNLNIMIGAEESLSTDLPEAA